MKAPIQTEIEISVFGPGWGESILIHYGYNEWLIIDSCLDPNSKLPAAFEYLNKIGVNCKKAVKHIIISHWHDDHVRGISKLIKECSDATIWCSAAYASKDFIKWVSMNNQIHGTSGENGLSEFHKVFQILSEQKRIIHHTMQDRIMSQEVKSCGLRFSLSSVSPSDLAINNFLNFVVNSFPVEGKTQRNATAPDGNEAAVTNIVTINDDNILLGADMPEIVNNQRGWNAIIDSILFKNKDFSFLKIPHHGGLSGHSKKLWKDYIQQNATCVLTPWSRNQGLPSEGDISRICDLRENVYSTSKVNLKKKHKREHVTKKLISNTAHNIRLAEPETGQVRVRSLIDQNNSWMVELIESACHLSQART